MNPLQYVKVGICVLGLFISGYIGFSIANSRLVEYKARQAARVQEIQEQSQAAADQIRKQKDAQIASINSQLADAISQLRNRPSRAQSAANGQGGTGASLFAEDAEFLIREATRADQIRIALDACYQQYDAVAK